MLVIQFVDFQLNDHLDSSKLYNDGDDDDDDDDDDNDDDDEASFSAPKMLHTLRCSPCANHPSLAVFDNFLRKGICAICNLDLSDPQWLQASLPV